VNVCKSLFIAYLFPEKASTSSMSRGHEEFQKEFRRQGRPARGSVDDAGTGAAAAAAAAVAAAAAGAAAAAAVAADGDAPSVNTASSSSASEADARRLLGRAYTRPLLSLP